MALQLLKHFTVGPLEREFFTRITPSLREQLAIGETHRVSFQEGPEAYIVESTRIDEVTMQVSVRRADSGN
jgi:hypothetical protein